MTNLLNFDITAANWKDIVNAVIPVSDECRINFNKNGIEIKQTDATNVCMVMIDLPKKCFKLYKVPKPPVQVGFDFYTMDGIKLTSVSKRANTFHNLDDIYSFEICQLTGLHPDQPLYIADIQHGIFCEDIQLLDPVSIRKNPKVPNTEMDSMCKVNMRLLNQILSRNDKYIQLSISEKIQSFIVNSGDDKNKWKASIPCVSITGNSTTLYDRVWLKNIIKSCKESEILIKMSTDYPMTVSFPICEFGTCTYLLAPRIKSE